MLSTIDSPWNRTDSRVRGSTIAAVILHLMLFFGLGFAISKPAPPAMSLEVTLSNFESEKAPEQADFLAQTNQQGSGDQLESAEITTDMISEFQSDNQSPVPQQQQQLPKDSDARLLSRKTDKSISDSEKPDEQTPVPSETQQLADTELGSMRAKLDQLKQNYSKMPNVLRMTAASTKSADEAAYMNYYEERIEQVGNLNYPEEARRRNLTGKVQVAVTILADGSVKSVDISKSSGSHILDQAAVRSVRLAAPFSAFPPELRHFDEIQIIRTWQYENDLATSTR